MKYSDSLLRVWTEAWLICSEIINHNVSVAIHMLSEGAGGVSVGLLGADWKSFWIYKSVVTVWQGIHNPFQLQLNVSSSLHWICAQVKPTLQILHVYHVLIPGRFFFKNSIHSIHLIWTFSHFVLLRTGVQAIFLPFINTTWTVL